MAGGGIKGPAWSTARTDDFSYNVVENPVHIHNITRRSCSGLGIDHKRLSVKHQGLDLRLTGVEDHGRIKAILA